MDLASQYTLPDVDFIMSTSDSCQDWNQLPMSKDGNATKCDRNVSTLQAQYLSLS